MAARLALSVAPAALLSVVALVLAGCADPGLAPEPESAGFDDLGLSATPTTGLIRGVVVDERIVPVLGALVSLGGAIEARNMTSDEQGRFVFADLAPGTYFLRASSPLHLEAQTSVEVVAGVSEPPVTKLLLERRFTAEPFVEAFKQDGFLQCNQAGIYYATAPCVTDFTGIVSGPLNGTGPCTAAGCAPELRRLQTENRGFHTGVGAGWQALVFEMTWIESSETFERLGLTVSYNVTQRPASHNYVSYSSASPLRVQLDVGVDHENSNSVEPELIPAEGRPDLYYFVGVRTGPLPVAVAVNQQFQLFGHFFYYGVPPADWSFVAGDPLPF